MLAKKLFVSVLLIPALCAPLVSMALAAPDENRAPAADSPVADDGQMLIAPAPEDKGDSSDGNMLIQPRDSNATSDDSAAGPVDGSEDEASLIATNTSDNTAVIAGVVLLAVAVAVGASIAVVTHRRK